jgi:hypothetical protein
MHYFHGFSPNPVVFGKNSRLPGALSLTILNPSGIHVCHLIYILMSFKFFLKILIYVSGAIFEKNNFISSTALIVGLLSWKLCF